MTPGARRTVRTAFQATVAAAAAMPLVVEAIGLNKATAGVGIFVGVATGLTRVMALPVVDAWIEAYVPWLHREPPAGGDGAGE